MLPIIHTSPLERIMSLIRVKLMGMLKEKTPLGGQLELPSAATIEDALHVLDIPVESVQVFTVNGALQRSQKTPIKDGDELVVFPPVGGG